MPRTRTANKKKGGKQPRYQWQNQYGNKPYYSKSRYPSKRRDEGIYNKVFAVETQQTTTLAGGDVIQNLTFSLSSASATPNYGGVTNLFAQYRINKVELTITPSWNTSAQSTTTLVGAETGVVTSCINYSPTAPSNNAGITGRNTFMQTMFDKVHKRTLYPKLLQGIASTGGAAFTVIEPTWLDIGDTTVPHYAIAVKYPAPSQTATNIWTVTARLFCSFKNNV